VVLSAKLLQRWPESVSRIATTGLFSLQPEMPYQRAKAAPACAGVCRASRLRMAGMRIYMLFVSTKESLLRTLCACAARAHRRAASVGLSFATLHNCISSSLLASRCWLLTVTLLESDIWLGRNGYNGSWR